ncbi:MAG: hypothetical protein JWN71_2105 [Xanthobacteraceae bacterium]|jgi:hypothetical protein|nr:hypothetical protein [Xanthobacteraceae bacterium]
MTPVSGITSGSFAAIGTGRASRSRPSGEPAAPKTAQVFVPVRPAEPAQPAERYVPRHQRPDAAFLAHLIATKEHAPQTRERRRAEPQTAVAIYGAAVALQNSVKSSVGRTLAISA